MDVMLNVKIHNWDVTFRLANSTAVEYFRKKLISKRTAFISVNRDTRRIKNTYAK